MTSFGILDFEIKEEIKLVLAGKKPNISLWTFFNFSNLF